jgi:PPOX class probable F420-dependent enzyme
MVGVLTEAGRAFVLERHLATLTTQHSDGRPHVTPVGFTWDDAAAGSLAVARVITSGASHKARNAARGTPVTLCQVDGRRWLSIEGIARVSQAPDEVADAEQRYARRYRPPRPNPDRVVIIIEVGRVYGSAALRA